MSLWDSIFGNNTDKKTKNIKPIIYVDNNYEDVKNLSIGDILFSGCNEDDKKWFKDMANLKDENDKPLVYGEGQENIIPDDSYCNYHERYDDCDGR